MAARNTNVIMLGATHDAENGELVKVTAEEAERLIANHHAREPYPGEVKKAAEA